MLFKDLQVGQRFDFDNTKYVKITEVRKNCCKVDANAVELPSNKQTLINNNEEVEVTK